MTELTPMDARVRDVAAFLFDRMPPEMRAECDALIALDPACAGIRVHIDGDMAAFTYVGRWLGSAPLDWLVNGDTGEVRDDDAP